MSQVVENAHAWLAANESRMIEDLRALLRIPSIQGDPEPNAPFGAENRKALDAMLARSEAEGMTTHDVEGYCGWAEFGKGPGMVMVLGHLDVVPVGPGWKHEPFGAEMEEGYIYARGASDDKGPTVASFYAALALRQAKPELASRIRFVFGCNEESGFGCVHRYMETEEAPTFGVAPDGGWPLIHAEKGIADFHILCSLPKGDFELLSIEGGQRPNIVIDSCKACVKVSASARKEVDEKLAQSWDRNLTFAWEGDVLNVDAIGKAAHGSWPYGGDNAAIRILRFLSEVAPLTSAEAYRDLFGLAHSGGRGMGIEGADEVSKDLTANLGIIETVNGNVRYTMNVRYPVTWKGADIEARCKAHLAKLGAGWSLESMSDSPSLYFPLDHPMVKAIVDSHHEETGEVKEPGVMGGGTYARAVPNSVAIGTGWLGDGPAHETDERIALESLRKMARIYVRILDRLTDLAAETTANS